MSAPATASSPALDETDDAGSLAQMEDELQAAEEEGGIETCASADFTWYADAGKDVQRYLDSLGKDLASIEKEAEDGENEPATTTAEESDDFADLGQNRSASYNGWEDEDLAEWIPEKLLKRSNRKGVAHYLVKWQNHDTATWESSEDLDEEGHFNLMANFDATLAAQVQPKKVWAPRPKVVTPLPPLPMGFDPTAFWPDYVARIRDVFYERMSSHVTEIHNVLTKQAAKAFMNHWRGDTEFVPAMLFHGTRLESISSIINQGFCIPRQGPGGVAVVNGSAHGVGIYTATTPEVSLNYAHGNCMFVCAGLVGGSYWTTTKNVGQVCVFFQRNRVVPCFLVKFESSNGTEPEPELKYFPEVDASKFKVGEETPSKPKYVAPPRVIGPNIPRTLRSGGQEPGMSFTKSCRTLTKKQLRGAPRVAKEAYKAGLLLQYSK
ncbi:hypothetical protein DIPPA_24571 [Diplonema papillatum]|nr:hypothetical protein DIPPA_24571 [Diplonema papillatum]